MTKLTFLGEITAGLCAIGLMAGPVPVHGSEGDLKRLEARLDSKTMAAIEEVLQQCREQGTPERPILAIALEGVARGVDPERILAAVRLQANALGRVRQAMGPRTSQAELQAAASAYRAGVPVDSLASLRRARDGGILVPLVVIGDLVARGVEPLPACASVIAPVRFGASDEELLTLRVSVARDIGAGTRPIDAAQSHTQALLLRAVGRAPGSTPRVPNASGPP